MNKNNIPEKDDEWGNIELPNVPDTELYGYNWNYSKTKEDKARQKIAMQNRDNSSHKEAGKKRAADPEWRKNQAEASRAKNKEMVQTEEWKTANAKKYEDPTFWENYYAAIKERDANPEYHKKRLGASKQKIRKPVQTPLGVFETQTDAAKAHGLGNTETIRTRIKSSNPKFSEYKSLTVEEYERLKNDIS